MEYYSVLKRKENLTHNTKWMNTEEDMLGETSQSQTSKDRMIPFTRGPWNCQIRDRKYTEGDEGLEGEEGNGKLFNVEFQFCKKKGFWR